MFQLKVVSAPDQVLMSNSVNVTIPNSGKCGNPGDMAVLRSDTVNGATAERCDIKAGYDQKVQCFEDLGLSNACSQCWADEYKCILSKCLLHPDMNKCVVETCQPLVAECGGIPLWTLVKRNYTALSLLQARRLR